MTFIILGLHKITPVSSCRIQSPSMDSKLKIRRKVSDENDMQRAERGRERAKKKKKGMNKVDQDSESMPRRQFRYDGETSVTFRSNITYAILFFSSAIFSNY